jgi:transcriptional regulator with XRE-family HTH domain
MPSRARTSRLLLPRGVGRLRADLGEFLKHRRQGKLDSDAFGTQADVAARAGIRRQTLSEIERGAAWPGPDTLDALLDILDLGWEHVAHSVMSRATSRNRINDMPGGGWLAEMLPASAPRRHRTCLEGVKGKQIIYLGERLRAARKRHGLTLAAVADRAGLSPALLSRLERGQLGASHVFRFDPPDSEARAPQLIILNPFLARLCGEDQGMLVNIQAEKP